MFRREVLVTNDAEDGPPEVVDGRVHVRDEGALERERLAAQLADVRFLGRVHEHVLLEVRLLRVRLPADLANERLPHAGVFAVGSDVLA